MVKTLLPVELGPAKIRYARGVRAGPWIFATGQMAQDFAQQSGGIDPAVIDAASPHYGVPRHEKEAARIYDNITDVLRSGGAQIENVVRVDQYYVDHRAVDPYHVIRKSRLGTRIPPSTSIIVKNLLLPDAGMDAQAIALHPEAGAPEPLRHRDLDGPATSGYSPALRAGGFVFIAGVMASAKPGEPAPRGIASAARVPDGSLWKGQPIKLEAEYVITEKLKPALALAGCTFEDVVKAQIYLTHADDAAAFNQVWNRHFGSSPAATSVIVCADPGLGLADARLEINVIALAKSSGASKTPVCCAVDPPYAGHVVGVRAGDFLFLSGLMAADRNGILPEAKADPRQPHFHAGAGTQARAILRNAQVICAAAGASLQNVVRVQQFHTDLREFYSVYAAWQEVLPGHALPFSAVEVPAMTVPGCSVLMDLWVYAPPKR
jgi:enamine deaminase RidA (YjgF/YER057c/UK114 family)